MRSYKTLMVRPTIGQPNLGAIPPIPISETTRSIAELGSEPFGNDDLGLERGWRGLT
jgi:hypothetical protein